MLPYEQYIEGIKRKCREKNRDLLVFDIGKLMIGSDNDNSNANANANGTDYESASASAWNKLCTFLEVDLPVAGGDTGDDGYIPFPFKNEKGDMGKRMVSAVLERIYNNMATTELGFMVVLVIIMVGILPVVVAIAITYLF